MAQPTRRTQRLADLPIYARVSLAPGLVLLVLLLLSLVSLRSQQESEVNLQAITEHAFPTFQRAAETKDAVNAIQTALQHTLSVAANESDAARIRTVAGPVRLAITRTAAALDRLEQQLGARNAVASALRQSFGAYQAAATEVLDTAVSDSATATMLMAGVDDQFTRLSTELDGAMQQADEASQAMSRAAITTAEQERVLLLSGVALAVFVCLGVIIATARAIGRPIMSLTSRMVAMADGDLDGTIPALGRGNEIGAMARAVDIFRRNGLQAREHMMERERDQTIRHRNQTAMDQHTEDFGTTISGVMASLIASAAEMHRAAVAMTEAATGVHQQAGSTAEDAGQTSLGLGSVAAAIEQLTASVGEISRQVMASGDVARQAVKSAGSGQETMRQLASAASRIGDVVRLISTIASKTNLLALNATIEAARAGEAGRGFAVVAGEVKTLAAQTAKATADIESLITAVCAAADASLTAMADVSGVIRRMDEVSSAIAAAVEQQTATTRELAASIQVVSRTTDQTAHAMEDVAGIADHAGGVSREVLGAADTIGQKAENLRSEVNNFLAILRDVSRERRLYERVPANGVPAALHVPGRAPIRTTLKDLSRDGATLNSDLPLVAGSAVDVELPGTDLAVTGRVVRCAAGLIVVSFHQDAAALVQIDRALDAVEGTRKVA